MAIDYEKVKSYIKASMPDKYLNGEAVTIKTIKGQCPDEKINWLPYRNDGEKLPINYKFYWNTNDCSNEKGIKAPKGYTWLIKYLSEAYRNNDADILPAAFIHLFVRDALDRIDYDVKADLSLSSRDMLILYEASRDELLITKGYSIPDNHCKRFLDLNLEELLCLISGRKRGEKLIADVVLSVINNMTKRYILVEERYSDEE